MIIHTQLRLVLIYNVYFSIFKQETRDQISAGSGFVRKKGRDSEIKEKI